MELGNFILNSCISSLAHVQGFVLTRCLKKFKLSKLNGSMKAILKPISYIYVENLLFLDILNYSTLNYLKIF